MNAIRAIFDGTNFKPLQPIPVKGEYEVVITFVEPINTNNKLANTLKRPRAELIGILKDKVWMSDDFDAPLEEMREYME
ncbi:MAG: DUF2281 domain-containing protein [Oscillospiraceae bacterium]|nr:DUF2281 domain-containing protein [Oscillospiraceae bacterium]